MTTTKNINSMSTWQLTQYMGEIAWQITKRNGYFLSVLLNAILLTIMLVKGLK